MPSLLGNTQAFQVTCKCQGGSKLLDVIQPSDHLIVCEVHFRILLIIAGVSSRGSWLGTRACSQSGVSSKRDLSG